MKSLTLKEKFLSIIHILLDHECAVYTATVKDGKRVNGRSYCAISENASDVFLISIIKYTAKVKRKIKDIVE